MKLRAAVLVVLPLLGCGGGGGSASPSGPTPVATPTPPARAVVTVGGVGTYTVSGRQQVVGLTLLCGDVHVDWTFAESAGLGASVTQADVWILEADGDISDRRVSTEPLAIPAGGTARATTDRSMCGYQERDFPAVVRAVWDLRDAAGNTSRVENAIALTVR